MMSDGNRLARDKEEPVVKALDSELAEAQATLLARLAPDSRISRIRWSQGETQLLELGDGPPLLLVHGGADGAFEWVPILPALARNRRVLAVDRPGLWAFHCHILPHVEGADGMFGMVNLLLVVPTAADVDAIVQALLA